MDNTETADSTNEICFVVVNYFSHEKVKKLLLSIAPQDGICGIVVDNSEDNVEFEALKKSVERDDIKCIQSEKNGGFSYGTNIGIREGIKRAEAILILNPDTELTPNFFSSLKALRHAIPDAAVSPKGRHMGTGKVWSAGGKFFWLRGRADVLKEERRSGETSFGTCACLLVPKTAIVDIGLLDEDFFLGGEEWDYSRRLNRAGWPILYSAQTVYDHEVSGTHEKYGLRFFYIGMRTKVLFARKHYGIFFWPWLLFIMIPTAPVLVLRNSKSNHGKIRDLVPRLILATKRSALRKKITRHEFLSEGSEI